MVDDLLIHGTVDPAFRRVRESFEHLATREADLSAQLCVYHRGRQVVDLWTGQGVAGDSLMGVYSVSKGAAFLVMALLIQDGLLDPEAQVSTYWPELVATQDHPLTVRQLLGHSAGLIGVDGGLAPDEVADDTLIATRLETQQPYWQPGSAHGYHALTMGALAGALTRHVTGSTLQQVYETRIRVPYNIDFYLGLPEKEEIRYLTVQPPAGEGEPLLPDPDSLIGIAINLHAAQPTDFFGFPNDRVVRAKGQASGGGTGSARGLARLYAASTGLEGQAPLLNSATIATITKPQQAGIDQVFGFESRYLLGFGAMQDAYPSLGARAFGHYGAVGSLALADPDAGLAYGFTRRRFSPYDMTADVPNQALTEAMVAAAESA